MYQVGEFYIWSTTRSVTGWGILYLFNHKNCIRLKNFFFIDFECKMFNHKNCIRLGDFMFVWFWVQDAQPKELYQVGEFYVSMILNARCSTTRTLRVWRINVICILIRFFSSNFSTTGAVLTEEIILNFYILIFSKLKYNILCKTQYSIEENLLSSTKHNSITVACIKESKYF